MYSSYQSHGQYAPPAPQYGTASTLQGYASAGYTSSGYGAEPLSQQQQQQQQQQYAQPYGEQQQQQPHAAQYQGYQSSSPPPPSAPYGAPQQHQGSSYPPPSSYHHHQGYSSSPPPSAPPQQVHNQQYPPYHQSSPPPPPQQQHQPAGQPPLPYNIGSDPNVFRGYFAHELKQLTFNSKPIINGLTILAHENAQRMAPIVCQCLEEHIRQAHPTVKLPALYLLDSICKNIGLPYTSLFSRTIDRIFLTAYHDVEPQTKVKLEELVSTWRTGGQDGGELFNLPPSAPAGTMPPQGIIENALFGPPQGSHNQEPASAQYGGPPNGNHNGQYPPQHIPAYSAPAPPPPRPPTPPRPADPHHAEKTEVLGELRKLLELRRSQVKANPNHRGTYDQINTLKQLELLVTNTIMNPAQIAQIREQLAKLSPQKQQPRQVPKQEYDGFDQRSMKRQRLMSPSYAQYSHQPTPPPSGFPGTMPSALDLAALASRLNPDIIRSASAQGRASATPPPHAYAGTPLPAAAAIPPSHSLSSLGQHSTLPAPLEVDSNAAQLKLINDNVFAAYEHHRIHFTVQLQSSDIARYRPGSSALVYEAMPLVCKQCGSRYLDSPLGKERLDRDLDRHLRISRRYTEGVGAQRGIARSWFTVEEEWVLPPNKVQPSAAVLQDEMAKKKAQNAAESMNKVVPVPEAAATDTELAHCPICKEAFKNEYSEEEEDWVWRNCVEIDGKYYHASCKAEQDD